MALEKGKPTPFQVSWELTTAGARFSKWLQNFEYYLAATAVSDEQQKVALMLYVAGSEVQDIFKGLTIANSNSYTEVKEALTRYFEPYTNVQYERYTFFQAVQEPKENIDLFVSRLKNLSAKCAFDKIKSADDLIVSSVISKCRSQELRKKLLQEKNLDLKKVLTIARSLESANKHLQAIEAGSQNAINVNKVNVG